MQGTRNIRNWVPAFTGNPGFLLPPTGAEALMGWRQE